MNERLNEKNRKKQEALMAIIQEQLGHIGLDGYTNLPRKRKKATKKRALTQLEQSRLNSMRNQENDS